MAASESTQRCWAIAEKIGLPVAPRLKVYEAVCDELMEQPVERNAARAIATYLAKWKERGNPFYIDAAFILLAQTGGTPTETMLQEDTAARAARFHGSPAGTSDAIKNENAEWAALMLMANFIFNGISLGDSARKAAAYYSIKYPDQKRKKASTLERFYTQKIRNPGLEGELFATWGKHPTPEWSAQWAEIAQAIPECPEELIGNPRD